MIVRFARGEIDSDDLESEWPTSAEDRAIEAIGSMLWLHYDDHKPRRMVARMLPHAKKYRFLADMKRI